MILEAIYVFLKFLEIVLFLYIIVSWIPISNRLNDILKVLIDPALNPVRYLVSKSIFKTRIIDISPIIVFVIISYLQEFVLSVKQGIGG